MNRSIFLTLCFSFSLTSFGQWNTGLIDSLQQAFDAADTSYVRGNINRLLEEKVAPGDPLIEFHVDSNSYYFFGFVNQFNGIQALHRNDLKKASDLFTKARTYFEMAGDDHGFHHSGYLISHAESRLGVFNQSSAYLIPALNYFKEKGDTASVIPILKGLSYAYYMGKDQKMESYYRDQQLNWSMNPSYCNDHLEALRTLSRSYREQNKFDSSLYALEMLLDEVADCPQVDSNDLLGMCYTEMAQTRLMMDSSYNADPLLYRAFRKFKQSHNPFWCGHIYSVRADGQFMNGNYKRAVELADSGYQYCVEHELVKEKRDNLSALYQGHAALGNYKEAFRFYQEYIRMQSVLDPGDGWSFMKEEEMKLKAEKDRLLMLIENERVLASESNQRNVYLGLGLLVLLISVGLWSRLRFTRKAKASIEKEKERSEDLLLNILPAQIADELKLNGSSRARSHDMVTILFTDFRQFTQTAERLSAEDLVQELDYCFSKFDQICEKYNIEKIKTIGDAYMAVGGIDDQEEGSCLRTVQAALEMSAFMKERYLERQKEGKFGFEMRVGLHTGRVVAGIVGVKKFQYDIWGDTVNTASRMESNGEVGKVNISHTTYEQIKDDPTLTFESRGKIEAKGKGAIDMFFVARQQIIA